MNFSRLSKMHASSFTFGDREIVCASPFADFLNVLLQLTLFTNPSARAGYDTRSIFKRSLTSLNSEFSFS